MPAPPLVLLALAAWVVPVVAPALRPALGARLAMGPLLGVVAALVALRLGLALRRAPREHGLEVALGWVAWAALLCATWRAHGVAAPALAHLAHYALVGLLLALALDGGKRPAAALLIALGLAVVDGVVAHHVHAAGDRYHALDFTLLLLAALGAAAGVLPPAALARLEPDAAGPLPRAPGEPPPEPSRGARVALLAAAALTLPLLLLPPLATTRVFGHHRAWPPWSERHDGRWPGPRQGLPLLLAVSLGLVALVERRATGAVTALAVLWAVSVDPPSRARGTPVREEVPAVVAPRAASRIVVDGVLDEPAWRAAPVVGPFTLLKTGAPSPTDQPTRARVLWDDQALYVAFEVVDRDVWARPALRDDPYLPSDEVVEVFLDDGGDEVTYYEVEVSPTNVVYDLFCFVGAAPFDYDPEQPPTALAHWDGRALPDIGPALETAVTVQGTVDVVASGAASAPGADVDRGWTVELALPWGCLWRTSRPAPEVARAPAPPRPGDRWRLALTRIERPRLAPDPARAPADAARAFEAQAEYQTWSPTWDPRGSYHRPQFFGVLEFGP